jgi:antitoxin HigA-1
VSNHPGQFLRFLIIEEEISAYVAAEHTGLTMEQIGEIIAGRLSVTPEIAAKLGKLSGTTTEMWVSMQRAFDEDSKSV